MPDQNIQVTGGGGGAGGGEGEMDEKCTSIFLEIT